MRNKVIFVSNRYIKDNSIIEKSLDDKILRVTVYEVQDLELKPIIGKELYKTLEEEVKKKNDDSSYVIPDKYLDLLDVIRPFISYGVLVHLVVPITYKATNKGFAVKNDTNASVKEGSDLQFVMNYYKTKFDTYKKRLSEEVGKHCNSFMEKDLGWTTGWYIQNNQSRRERIERAVNKY